MDRENLIAVGIAILISIVFIFSGSVIRIIPVGCVGVVFNLFGGVEKRVLNEGINILIPIIETVTVYDARKTSYNFTDSYDKGSVGQSIRCQTNDGQQVAIDVTVIAHLDKEKTWQLHQTLGKDYAQRLIVPQTRSTFRNIVAKYPIDSVYTATRGGLLLDAQKALREGFFKSEIYLDELLIRGVEFSSSFAEAVERKQIALQEAQRQNWIKKTAERDKERKIIEGEGDARALEVRGQALRLDPRIAELEFLEQLEKRDTDVTVITGAMSTILSLTDELLRQAAKQSVSNELSKKDATAEVQN